MAQLLCNLILVLLPGILANAPHKRSLDLLAAYSELGDERIKSDIYPTEYTLMIQPFIEEGYFTAWVQINMTWREPQTQIKLYADPELELTDIRVIEHLSDSMSRKPALKHLRVESVNRNPKKSKMVLTLDAETSMGMRCSVDMNIKGKIPNNITTGIFRRSYVENKVTKWYVATSFRPAAARKVFPCFDEPKFKVPFHLHVARKKTLFAMANSDVYDSSEMIDQADWVWDNFRTIQSIALHSIGFIVGDLATVTTNISDSRTFSSGFESKFVLSLHARSDFMPTLQNTTEKIVKVIKMLEDYWDTPYPTNKLDIVALPNYQAFRPSDSLGLILFKESDLLSRGYWHICQELVYQWLGHFVTPEWWIDAPINNALVRYITAITTSKLDEPDSYVSWPMTILYSIYYEFSKRYPYGLNSAIKHDSGSAKIELLFRMFNFTIGEKPFQAAIRKFLILRRTRSFIADDIWASLNLEGRTDRYLDTRLTASDIADSWVTKDRLPLVTVIRNYEKSTANMSQKVFLRERPQDVPDGRRMFWYIPIIFVKENDLKFNNFTPTLWLRGREPVTVEGMPDSKHFVIVNPEEIGPFPVNYDKKNWAMLAKFLCGKDRTKIPVFTRAKLLHDAWNIAFAGELDFATALNMTLFLKYEREFLVWNPVFTLIDHVGKYIDHAAVTTKFQAYVRALLTPLYLELGTEPKEGENESQKHLRDSTKLFLCQAGYKPCIEEAQQAFSKWQAEEDPDEGNPLSNQYICPVFKWGTQEEWEFGLQRVIKFPASRKASERTYLLKTLAGCPNDPWKVERLLNVTILERNASFTASDMYLIFSMLSGNANGYTTLFEFLKENWDDVKPHFKDNKHMWGSLVTAATSVFKTQEGLDMVSELYVQRQNEFDSADFVVEKALKQIKEEAKWSNENLPVIEKWLDDYFEANNITVDQ